MNVVMLQPEHLRQAVAAELWPQEDRHFRTIWCDLVRFWQNRRFFLEDESLKKLPLAICHKQWQDALSKRSSE